MTAGEKFLADYERTVAKIKAARASKARVRDAAPDLLAALKKLLADWDSADLGAQSLDEIKINEHWDAGRAAIAKAGEWPAEDDDR